MSYIAIVDYELGNLGSLHNALQRLGYPSRITDDAAAIEEASAVILPGVGAAGAAMANLRTKGLDRVLRAQAAQGKPLLGICLGMQVLFSHSEEGDTACLGLIEGGVRRFSSGKKVPQIGWNQVRAAVPHPLLVDIPDESYFYFVNSYYSDPAERGEIVGVTDYGETFCSVVARANLYAVQFHPERSGDAGLKLLENFVRPYLGQLSTTGDHGYDRHTSH